MQGTFTESENIARRLKLAREMAGLSQNQVAHLLGLKRPAISEIEAGRRKVSAVELSKLSEIYDIDVNWVLSKHDYSLNEMSEKVELAAREFSKLKPEDIDKLMRVLSSLRK